MWDSRIKWGNEGSFCAWFFIWQRGKVKEEEGGKELLQSERERFLSPSWYIPTLLRTHSLSLSLSLSLFYFFLFHFLSIRMNRLISLFIINYNPNYTSPTKLLERSIWCIKGKNIISWHALQTIFQSSVSSFKGSIFIQISRLKDSSSIC